MAKRFKSFKRSLQLIKVGTGNTPPVAPVGSPLEGYQKWRSGATVLTYPRPATSNQVAMTPVAIHPFGIEFDATFFNRVLISQRVLDASTLDSIQAVCNIEVDPAKIPDNKSYGFLPARATIRKKKTAKAETSDITGLKYQDRTEASWTFPYGKKAATNVESEIRSDILTAVKGVAGHTVTFTSEKL